MAQATLAYVGLGSNLGDRQESIRQAVRRLDRLAGVRVARVSPLRDSAALGGADQPAYLNGVAEIETALSARAFFNHLMDIEQALGRERSGRWESRTIDLDLLLFGDEVIGEPDLEIPHPRMLFRHFVLEPLAELAPDLCLPELAVPVCTLAARLNGHSYAYSPTQPALIAVAGNIGAGKTTLADRLGPYLDAEVLHEPYDSNPFLAQVYAGRQDLALDSQLYFLANRADQLAPDRLAGGHFYVTDYLFEKERIYAGLLLTGAQRDLYERLYPHLAQRVVTPTLVLYLHHGVEDCLERIQHRGREYEQGIREDFLEALRHAYESLLANWNRCPVIHLSAPEFDCLHDEHLAALAHQIRYYLPPAPDAGNQETKGPAHAGR